MVARLFARLFRHKPRPGPLPGFRRAYLRERRGRWWEWRHWSKKANRAYHAARLEGAIDAAIESVAGSRSCYDPPVTMNYGESLVPRVRKFFKDPKDHGGGHGV